MKFNITKLEGVYIIDSYKFADERGTFIKTYHDVKYKEAGISYELKESFYTISKKDVIRGMHFQVPPFDYSKLVYVIEGEVIDVILDLRKGAPTYGKHISVQLSGENARQVYIPEGFAHGFATLSCHAKVIYLQSKVHAPQYDLGIRWNSFGMNWGIKSPILSRRDQLFPTLDEFNAPFLFEGKS